MSVYQFVTQARNGAAIADVGPALTNRRISLQLNRPGIITASIRADDPKAARTNGLAPGQHELIVYRAGSPIETVYQLAEAKVSADENTTSIDLEWHGIGSYLQDMLILPQAAAFSGTTLPWTWIDAAQTRTGGDYGITQGAQTGTPATRQKLIQQHAEVLASINDLAESGDGFDHAINASRQYVEWHTQRGADTGLVLEYGVNVRSYAYTEATGPGQITSDVYVIGPPGSQIVTASSVDARTMYGRREAAATFFADFENSTITTGQLQSHADRIAAERVAPKIIPSVVLATQHPSVEWGAYDLGDTITFRARAGEYATINQQYRIVQINIDLDDNDNERVSLTLNEVTE